MKRILFCCILLALCIACAPLVDIPLEWRPTNGITSFDAVDLSIYNKTRFAIKPFKDLRNNPSLIGENIENKSSAKPVTTTENVAQWSTDKFSQTVSQFGINVVTSNPTLFVEGDVIKFFVTEDAIYRGEVALKLRLKNSSGHVLWEGVASGKATRFGNSYKAANYYEAISNATMNMVHDVLRNQGFLQAVQKTI